MDLLTSWDWLVLVTGLISTLIGFWRGAVRTLFGLGAWIVGVLASPFVVTALTGLIGTTTVPIWVLFIGAFLVVFVVLRFAGGLLLRGIRSIGLGGVDRAFGGALGVARAALIIMVAALIGYRMGLAHDSAWKAAQSRPLLDWMVAQVDPLLPASTPLGDRREPARERSDRSSTFRPDGSLPLVQEPAVSTYAVSAYPALHAADRQPYCGA